MEQLYDNWKERLQEILLEEEQIRSIEDEELRNSYWDRYVQLLIEEDELVEKLQEDKRRQK